jgi:transposase
MIEITTVKLDLAKRVVSLCGEDARGRVVVQRTLRREAVLAWFTQRPPCCVGMEACASAHWFARELAALRHTAKIIAPAFVRPFRLSGKNDTNDAAAICAAVRQPQLRFVSVKSAQQQARLVVHRLASGLAGRTHRKNQSPAWAARRIRSGLSQQCARSIGTSACHFGRETLPPALRRGVVWQPEHLREIEAHLADCDREIAQDVRDAIRVRSGWHA